jgi:hypothetical protein
MQRGAAREDETMATQAQIDGYDVTDTQIRELQREAAAAGDHEQMKLCRIACGDYEDRAQHEIQATRVECARIIAETANLHGGGK